MGLLGPNGWGAVSVPAERAWQSRCFHEWSRQTCRGLSWKKCALACVGPLPPLWMGGPFVGRIRDQSTLSLGMTMPGRNISIHLTSRRHAGWSVEHCSASGDQRQSICLDLDREGGSRMMAIGRNLVVSALGLWVALFPLSHIRTWDCPCIF